VTPPGCDLDRDTRAYFPNASKASHSTTRRSCLSASRALRLVVSARDPLMAVPLDVAGIVGAASNMVVGLVANSARLRKRPPVEAELLRPQRRLAEFGPLGAAGGDGSQQGRRETVRDLMHHARPTRRAAAAAYPHGAFCPLDWLPQPESVLRDAPSSPCGGSRSRCSPASSSTSRAVGAVAATGWRGRSRQAAGAVG
jgi:hypothetical protein